MAFVCVPGADPGLLGARMARALARLVHRGPDDGGTWSLRDACAGHRRLAIIDTGASRQPMCDASGRYVLTYNGEVYNYAELRRRLAPSWRFATGGDTEVVLAGLVLEGTEFLDRMEGMWALALWDSERRRLLLARDRMGKKPLYYRVEAGGLLCASELPALRALSGEPWSEDLDSTADYLRYGIQLPGHTAFSGVHELRPAHILQWSPGEKPVETRYWDLPLDAFSGNRTQATGVLHDALLRAVERRLVADVEVGAFLSGGVDSSLVVSLIHRMLGLRCKTFSIGFREPSFDETEHARRIARAVGSEHYEERVERWEPDRLVRLLVDHVGQPFMDASILPTAQVSALAARHVKVALSGDGADELFSGYQRYQAQALLRWYTRLPRALRSGAAHAVRALPEPMVHHSASLVKKAHLFVDIAERQGLGGPYVAPTWYSEAELARLAPDLAALGHRPPGLPAETGLDDVERMMRADVLVYLPQDILLKVDRASMAASLEARAPFLDRAVVELAMRVPRRWHRRCASGKRLLRETFDAQLPAPTWRRRKQGFAVPLGRWFSGALGDELASLARDDSGPVPMRAVDAMLAQHRAGTRDMGLRLWGLYAYLLWRREALVGAPGP